MSEKNRERIVLAVSFTKSLEHVKQLILHDLTLYISLSESFTHIPVFVEVDLLPCPVGFQLVSGKCVCHRILQRNNIHDCYMALILRPAPYWIGLPNGTNSSILIHPHCPFDYCQLKDINITAETTNIQCNYKRSGVLCGSCPEGLSMILGSSECKMCSNLYLLSITVFILMGVALVKLLTLLNMTVSVGTLNGLILFANILQANKTEFLPPTSSVTLLL